MARSSKEMGTLIVAPVGVVLVGGGLTAWLAILGNHTAAKVVASGAIFIGLVLFAVVWLIQRRAPAPSSDDRWYAISDQLGQFARVGSGRRFGAYMTDTGQAKMEDLVEYRAWALEAGRYLKASLGGAARHRFDTGRPGEKSDEHDSLAAKYDIRCQRLQYIIDHRPEFPINPRWRP